MIALFFDTETTGIKSWKDPAFIPRLVQLGCILQDLDTGRILGELNLIANQAPLSLIPKGASDVHGITDQMAADFGVDPTLIDVVFAELVLKADLIVAHNIEYDLEVVEDNMPLTLAAGKGKAIFDTMKQNLYLVRAPLSDKQKAYFGMKGIPPDAPYKVPNLTETFMHYFGVPFEGAHDAMADIRACRDIFLAMIENGWFEIIDGVVKPTSGMNKVLAKEGK
jgi:DNA polymerase-3 subunit epsilon